jgi:hypothetical protein
LSFSPQHTLQGFVERHSTLRLAGAGRRAKRSLAPRDQRLEFLSQAAIEEGLAEAHEELKGLRARESRSIRS